MGFFREREDIVFVLLLFFIAIGMCWPLFRNEFPLTFDHSASLAYHLAMRDYFGRGQFLPVWVPAFNHGYGGAVFNYYPPLFFLFSASIDALGVPAALAINLTCFLAMFLSAWAMFAFLKGLINSDGAFLGTVAYMMAPYHAFDLYHRGAYAELTSFIFLPLIFLGIQRMMKQSGFLYFSVTAMAIAGLLLSHMIMAVYFLPLAGFYLIYGGGTQKEFKLKESGIAVLAILGGFALAAFSILPAIIEKKYLNEARFTTQWFDYHLNFIYPAQLIFSPQQYGPWLDVSLANKQPFEFGWVYLLCLSVGMACVFALAAAEIKKIFLLFLLALLATVWMMTKYSGMVWGLFPILRLMQFPWRLLEPASFFVCLFIACAGLVPWGKYRRILCVMGVLLIIVTRMPDFKTLGWLSPVSNTTQTLSAIQATGRDFQPRSAMYDLTVPTDHLMDFPRGSGEIITHRQWSPVAHTFQILAQTPVVACFYNFYFPGWEVEVDGQKTKFLNNDYGLVLFGVPSGLHQVDIYFTATPVRIIAACISLFFLTGLLLMFILGTIRNRVYGSSVKCNSGQ